MSDPQTIREHLDAALNPGLIHEDEVIDHMIGRIGAALDLLDNAPLVGPVSSQTYRRMDTAGKRPYRVVDDPAPRGDAE